SLLQLMNVENTNPDDISLAKPDEVMLPDESETSAFENILTNYPAIESRQLALEVAHKDVTVKKNNYLPVLSAYYSYSSFYYLPLNQPGGQPVNPFWTQLNDNKNHYIGI